MNTEQTDQHNEDKKLVLGMGACYALGTFTDNFYKQCAVLLAASLHLTSMQSYATVLFALPFILFSAWAGWLADVLPKRTIVISAKLLELTAIIGGGFALVYGQWWGILLVVFCMGLQATFFSPAINGSIPENFAPKHVPRVNSLIKMASTVAVLAGIGLAGFFLDIRPASLPAFGIENGQTFGQISASIFIGIMALLGWITALTLNKKTAPLDFAKAKNNFPLAGPLSSFKHAYECRKDKELFLVILAEAYFYGFAAVAVISVSNISKHLGYSDTSTSILSTALMLGIAFGALIAGKRTAESWKRFLLPSCFGMGVFLLLAALAPLFPSGSAHGQFTPLGLQFFWLFICLMLCGVCGGIYLIPLASFIQVRPALTEKGKVLGVSNFLSFVAIAIFGAVFYLVSLLPAEFVLVFYGLLCIVFAKLIFPLFMKNMQNITAKDASLSFISIVMRLVFALRYRVHEKGLENIPAQNPTGKGTLFLPNHPALIDPLLVYSRIAAFNPRPLSDEKQVKGILRTSIAKMLNVITIPDIKRDGRNGEKAVKDALQNIVKAIENGENVLLYPSGRLYRSSAEHIGANSAVHKICESIPDARVVLVRTTGLWGSSFSHAQGTEPSFAKAFFKGIFYVLANAFFLVPKRNVHMEFFCPDDLPKNQDKKALNTYLEGFYNQHEHPALGVAHYFWEKEKTFLLPEKSREEKIAQNIQVTPEDRQAVYSLIRQIANLEEDFTLQDNMMLAGDLGIDSLGLMEIITGIEDKFGQQITNLEEITTVADCLLAAAGQLSKQIEMATVPEKWLAQAQITGNLHIATEHSDIVSAFLQQVKDAPNAPLMADKNTVRTRSETLLGALLFAKVFKGLPAKRLGIMLPASPAATICWLAALLAGKEPVMLNWTVGKKNLVHCLQLAEIECLVSANALLEQLAKQGQEFDDLPVQILPLEDMAKGFGLSAKLLALAKVYLHRLGMFKPAPAELPQNAVVLFTSGSEAAPKGVPLTHENLLTNARDITQVLGLQANERALAMLPPFHSFGLMVGVILPLAAGMAVAYHPNPTESNVLAFLIRDYKLTLLGATPTFLDGIMQKCLHKDYLHSVRFAFVGAEKCPEHVAELFSTTCPNGALCEGYGITECSPVVSVNQPNNIKIGSIGHILPSLEISIVKKDATSGEFAPVPQGQTGLLLVRGKSIFKGYLGTAPNPFIEFAGKSWYSTGDLVLQEQDGRLIFQGRLKRFAKIGGEMISLPQIENILHKALAQKHAELQLVAEVFGEQAGQPKIVVFANIDIAPQALNQILKQAGLSPLYNIKTSIVLENIPLLGTGKTDYRSIREMFENKV